MPEVAFRAAPLLLLLAHAAVLASGVQEDQTSDRGNEFVVTAYVPEYSQVDMVALGGAASHIILFSAQIYPDRPRIWWVSGLEVGVDGQILSSNPWAPGSPTLTNAQTAKDVTGVKLLLCIGGAGRSEFFMAMSSKVASRKAFAQNLISLARTAGLDGFDIDWEEDLMSNPAKLKGFGLVMKQLRKTFRKEGNLTLSVTYHPGQEDVLTPEILQAVDYVHLMSYDSCRTTPCRHATLSDASSHAAAAVRRVPPGNLVVGMPAYGRKMASPGEVETYRTLMARGEEGWSEGGDERDGFYLNGPATIRDKVLLAKRLGLAGVFLWEAGHDLPASHEKSLLNVMAKEAALIRAARTALGKAEL